MSNEMKPATFAELMKSQALIQANSMGLSPCTMSLTERATEVMKQQQFLLDEITEMMTALGGKYGKASWKNWKNDHDLVAQMRLEDLSPIEKAELLFECADVLIFVMNILSLGGCDGDDVLAAVAHKQEENLNRWASGY